MNSMSVTVESQGEATFTKTNETQKRFLQIHLTNGGSEDQPVTVKYYFFGRDIGGKETMVLRDGKLDVTVKSHWTETVKSEPASEVVTKAVRGKTGTTPAKGKRIVGYGVRVLQNGNVLTDYFSEPSLKDNVGGDR